MRTVEYTLTLTSDAEPGTGMAGELIDNYITRDHDGRPVIRASHLKGLMRDALARIAGAVEGLRGRDIDRLLDCCFGRPCEQGDDGALSRVRLTDASATENPDLRVIVRTAVSDLGTVAGTTLRATEAIPAGTCFQGKLVVDGPEEAVVDVAVRLALRAVEAVGARRPRPSCGLSARPAGGMWIGRMPPWGYVSAGTGAGTGGWARCAASSPARWWC